MWSIEWSGWCLVLSNSRCVSSQVATSFRLCVTAVSSRSPGGLRSADWQPTDRPPTVCLAQPACLCVCVVMTCYMALFVTVWGVDVYLVIYLVWSHQVLNVDIQRWCDHRTWRTISPWKSPSRWSVFYSVPFWNHLMSLDLQHLETDDSTSV